MPADLADATFKRGGGRVPRRSLGAVADLLVYALLLAFGALQLAFPVHVDDFFRGDTVYIELATSILERGSYDPGFNGVIYPPGLPACLALLCKAVSCSHDALVRSMAVFLTAGLIAGYQLIRNVEGRGVAAATCLLIASSPAVFQLSTNGVSSDLPYFFASMVTLAAAARADEAMSPRAQLLWCAICATALVTSLLFRSSGIALIAGLAGWLLVGGLWTGRTKRLQRLKTFSFVLLAGMLAQASWTVWTSRHETVEWPMLEGHPRSYVSQLKVKSGIRPELGIASVTDIPARVSTNTVERAVGLMQLLTRKEYIEPAWYSPLVLGSILLVGAGLVSSMREHGGRLAEWYFLAYESMYLVWPWPFEMRFLLPVAPLACLYAWRGGTALVRLASRSPRILGMAGVTVGLLAGASAASAGWASDAVQPKVAAAFWAGVSALAVWILLFSSSSNSDRQIPRSPTRFPHLTSRVGSVPLVAGVAAVATLVIIGTASQLRLGQDNLKFDMTRDVSHGTIVAARWIAENTVESAVIMAVRMDVVHHYSNRKVVYFPPLSDPRVLMQGISRLGVDYVIVTSGWTYYLPSENECIEPLLSLYPQAFRVAREGPGFRIVEVVHDSLPREVN